MDKLRISLNSIQIPQEYNENFLSRLEVQDGGDENWVKRNGNGAGVYIHWTGV